MRGDADGLTGAQALGLWFSESERRQTGERILQRPQHLRKRIILNETLQGFGRYRLICLECADLRAPERRDVTEAAELPAEIARDRAHICPLAAG